jgi:hypothetical protein
MKTRRYLLSFLSILLLLPAVARAQLWSGIIDSKRAIDWSQAGLPGSTLPDTNWPICTTISPYSGTDATITSALAACNTAHPAGGVVVLGAGTFTLSSGISFPVNTVGHLALRGQGANSTTIVMTTTNACSIGGGGIICMQGNDGSYPQQGGSPHFVNVTSGYSKGSTQLILDSLNTATVGSILVLNQCNTGYTPTGLGAPCTGTPNDNGGFFHCEDHWSAPNVGCAVASEGGVSSWRTKASEMEAAVITAINAGGCGATCVTLSKPVEQPDWASGTQAVVIHSLPYTGVENLTLDATGIGGTSVVGIMSAKTLHSWVSGVRMIYMPRVGVHFYSSFGSLVKDSYFFGTTPTAVDHAGIRLVGGANNLFQNNICHQVPCMFVGDAIPEQGDVYAYNFSPATGNGSNSNVVPAWLDHGAGNSFHLLEGNTMLGLQEDGDHGNHLVETDFRNFLFGWTSCANGSCGATGHAINGVDQTSIRLFYGARYDNIIGNVLGTPGFTTNYQSFDAFASATVYIWGAGQNGQPTDPIVGTTTMLWGNWDAVNSATRFNASEVPTAAPSYPNPVPSSQTLPPSFYLSSKPAWFGNIPWPAIGPDVTGGNVGQCAGAFDTAGKFNGVAATSGAQCGGSGLNTAWAGHINANPAMACYFSMGGLPDGTGPALSFNAGKCYGTSSSSSTGPAPAPPEHLVVTVD